MKRIGFLILAIITSLACCLGAVGCSKEKEKELNILDYFENKVSYSLYTTDESSKYYDAEKGYGVIPGFSDTVLYSEKLHRWGLTTQSGGEMLQYSMIELTPKTNINEVYVYKMKFTIETNEDCTLKLYFFGMVGLNEVPSNKTRLELNCKANEPKEVDWFDLCFGWTQEEAQNESIAKRKKIVMVLENKECGASYKISNLAFELMKA